jgi:hypothetical protein
VDHSAKPPISILSLKKFPDHTMARPIKETPTLRGKAALKFNNQLFANRTKKASPEEFAAIKRDFEFITTLSSKNGNK